MVNVGALSRRLLDERQRLLNRTQGAQAQEVEFDEAEPLHVIFIDLQCPYPIGRHADGQEV